MTAFAPGPDSLQRKALVSGAVAIGMFILGWVWGVIAVTANLGDGALFRPLVFVAAVQAVAGFRGLISTVKARGRGEMGLALTLAWAFLSLLLGGLGLVGVLLFLWLQSGVTLAFKG